MRECQWCGGQFEPSHPLTKYCSADCRRHGTNASKRKWREDNAERQLEYVRSWEAAHPEQARENHRRATRKWREGNREAHREGVRQWRKAHPELVREYTRKGVHRRRARLRGAETAPYDRLAIFERDGWECKLCGLPVNPEAQHPDPDFPTVDHIVPIAQGGSDTPDNVQTAHLRCNIIKGARVA